MKPSKKEIERKYYYDNGQLLYVVDSGIGGRYKAGTLAGNVNNQGIRMVQIDGKQFQAHQFIWTIFHGEWPERALRHVNGNLLDNRIENLEMDSAARGKRDAPLDVDRLNEVMSYNPETGLFHWKVSLRNRTLPGDLVGYINDSGYRLCVIDQQKIRLHKAAWAIHYGEMPPGYIDHINGIRDDNRIINLRLATKSQNSQNTATRVDNKTGVKGVHFRFDTNKYSATITTNKKTINLGCFDNLTDAKNARREAELKYHPYRAIGR